MDLEYVFLTLVHSVYIFLEWNNTSENPHFHFLKGTARRGER